MMQGEDTRAEKSTASLDGPDARSVEAMIADLHATLHREMEGLRSSVHAELEALRRDLSRAEELEVSRVNGVHGRVDVTRAEFLDHVMRLTDHVGESHHRMGLMTAELQRATDLFDLKLSAVEHQADRSLQAFARVLACGEEAATSPA